MPFVYNIYLLVLQLFLIFTIMCNLSNLCVFCDFFLNFDNPYKHSADFFLKTFFEKIKEDGNQSNHEP